jgi:hypothetical protein
LGILGDILGILGIFQGGILYSQDFGGYSGDFGGIMGTFGVFQVVITWIFGAFLGGIAGILGYVYKLILIGSPGSHPKIPYIGGSHYVNSSPMFTNFNNYEMMYALPK